MQQHLLIRMERRSAQAVVLETYPTRRQALQRKRKLCSADGVVLVLSGHRRSHQFCMLTYMHIARVPPKRLQSTSAPLHQRTKKHNLRSLSATVRLEPSLAGSSLTCHLERI